jgi:hypothetical protein
MAVAGISEMPLAKPLRNAADLHTTVPVAGTAAVPMIQPLGGTLQVPYMTTTSRSGLYLTMSMTTAMVQYSTVLVPMVLSIKGTTAVPSPVPSTMKQKGTVAKPQQSHMVTGTVPVPVA